MSNVKFVYLYRDGANYKSWNEIIFENPTELSLADIENSLILSFQPDKLFVASQIAVPEQFLFLEDGFTEDDHCYHEFDHVEFCEEQPTDGSNRSIAVFLRDVRRVSEKGWEAFDILEYAQRQR